GIRAAWRGKKWEAGGGVAIKKKKIQKRVTDYACSLQYSDLTPEVIHAAKVRVIDTLGVLICGFCGFFFQAEDGIRDWSVTGVQTVLFRSQRSSSVAAALQERWADLAALSAGIVFT